LSRKRFAARMYTNWRPAQLEPGALALSLHRLEAAAALRGQKPPAKTAGGAGGQFHLYRSDRHHTSYFKLVNPITTLQPPA